MQKAIDRSAGNLKLVGESSGLSLLKLPYADENPVFSAVPSPTYEWEYYVNFKKDYWTDIVRLLTTEKKKADAAGDAAEELNGLGAKVRAAQRRARDLSVAKAVLNDIAKDEAQAKTAGSGCEGDNGAKPECDDR